MPHLTCAACGRALTRGCRWGGQADYDSGCAMGAAPVPEGVLVRFDREDAAPIYRGGEVIGVKVFSPAGAIAADPKDVRPSALVSVGRDNGCCSSDGQGGPNRACLCGAVVATAWSDCWTQAEVRFLPDAVVVCD